MEVVNQPFDNRLTELKAQGTGADGVAKLAFDNRVNSFGFPALTIQTCQTGLRDAIRPRLPLGVSDFAVTPNRGDQISRMKSTAVKALVSQQPPHSTLTLIRAKTSGLA